MCGDLRQDSCAVKREGGGEAWSAWIQRDWGRLHILHFIMQIF